MTTTHTEITDAWERIQADAALARCKAELVQVRFEASRWRARFLTVAAVAALVLAASGFLAAARAEYGDRDQHNGGPASYGRSDDGGDFGLANQNAAWAAKSEAQARADAAYRATWLGRITGTLGYYFTPRSNTNLHPSWGYGSPPGGYVSADRAPGYGGWSW